MPSRPRSPPEMTLPRMSRKTSTPAGPTFGSLSNARMTPFCWTRYQRELSPGAWTIDTGEANTIWLNARSTAISGVAAGGGGGGGDGGEIWPPPESPQAASSNADATAGTHLRTFQFAYLVLRISWLRSL